MFTRYVAFRPVSRWQLVMLNPQPLPPDPPPDLRFSNIWLVG